MLGSAKYNTPHTRLREAKGREYGIMVLRAAKPLPPPFPFALCFPDGFTMNTHTHTAGSRKARSRIDTRPRCVISRCEGTANSHVIDPGSIFFNGIFKLRQVYGKVRIYTSPSRGPTIVGSFCIEFDRLKRFFFSSSFLPPLICSDRVQSTVRRSNVRKKCTPTTTTMRTRLKN